MKPALTVLLLIFAAATTAQPVQLAGGGYADLDGDVINYEYSDFGGFHVLLSDNKITWHGYPGFFKDIVSRVEPQVSRVADNVYFASWATVRENGDNVVWNFEDMRVYAHLGGGRAFKMIHGVIHCHNGGDCKAPARTVMQPQQRMQQLMTNVQSLGFANPGEAMAPTGEMGPHDQAGMRALTGKLVVYMTPEGLTKLEFQDTKTLVSIDHGPAETHSTHATLVADGVYFVSWGGRFGGNHVVFNANTMQLYDQIQSDGSRVESIHAVSCFAEAGQC